MTDNTPQGDTIIIKKGGFFSFLAFLLALASAAGCGYFYWQYFMQQPTLEQSLQSGRAAESSALNIEKRLISAEKNLKALGDLVAQNSQGLDKAEISSLIGQSLNDFSRSQNPAIERQMKNYVDEKFNSVISADEVNNVVNNAIAALKLDEKPSDVVALEAQGKLLQQQLVSQAQNLAAQLQQLQQNINKSIPKSLPTTLTLAAIAAQNGQFKAADRYIQEASTYPEAQRFTNEINSLRQNLASMPDNSLLIAEIQTAAKNLANWKIKESTNHAKLAEEKDLKGENFKETALNIGNRILNNTFKIVHNDEAGIVWVENHPELQELLKQSIKLNLVFAQNSVLMSNYEAYKVGLNQSIEAIKTYFDVEDEEVKKALDILEKAHQRANPQVPDIAGFASSVRQNLGN